MIKIDAPAAFGRLCVETEHPGHRTLSVQPAAFGRLCVETRPHAQQWLTCQPAAFGRLCVETSLRLIGLTLRSSSRLRAAVC